MDHNSQSLDIILDDSQLPFCKSSLLKEDGSSQSKYSLSANAKKTSKTMDYINGINSFITQVFGLKRYIIFIGKVEVDTNYEEFHYALKSIGASDSKEESFEFIDTLHKKFLPVLDYSRRKNEYSFSGKGVYFEINKTTQEVNISYQYTTSHSQDATNVKDDLKNRLVLR